MTRFVDRRSLPCTLAALTFVLSSGCGDTEGELRETWMVSVDSAGVTGDDDSLWPSISADGGVVAFGSNATNLVDGDTNGCCDIFVHYMDTGDTIRVPEGAVGNDHTESLLTSVLSADGAHVAFDTASQLIAADTNPGHDVYVYDIATGALEVASVDSSGSPAGGACWEAAVSSNGNCVAFISDAADLVAVDENGFDDVFVRDRASGQTERVSVDSSGVEANGGSWCPSISADGRYVSFVSDASNLAAGVSSSDRAVYVRDRQAGQTECVVARNNGTFPYNCIRSARISPDGRYVLIVSDASDLVADDTNGVQDVFVCDRDTSVITRASVSSEGAEGDDTSWSPSISSDGRFVAFDSYATNLVEGDDNDDEDVFVHDLQTGQTVRISLDYRGKDPNYGSWSPVISADGRFVAYQSGAADLVTYGLDYEVDVFVTRNPLVP